jgi:hypothetical protein
MLLSDNSKVIFKGVLNHFFQLSSTQHLSVSLAYSKRTLAEDNNIWYWTGQGYNLFDRLHIINNYTGKLDDIDFTTLALEWKNKLTTNLELILNSSYKIYRHYYLESQYFQLDTSGYSFSSPIELITNQRGHTFKQSVEFTYRFPSGFTHNIFYGYQKAINSDQAFMEAWKSLPKHKASYQLTFNPFGTFALWVKVSYLSNAFWPEYQDISGTIYYRSFKRCYYYSARIKSNLIVDLQIQKWFWSRKLVTKFILRNITNKELRYHPIGSTFGLTYYVQLGIYL